MGSSFSSLNKSWGCTSLGTSGNRSNRKELSGFCHCPKNCPSSYVLPSALQTKTNPLPIDELSTSIVTSPTVISTYSCTCKNSLAHHQINFDTRASNVDSSYQLCGVNSEAFIPTYSNISTRVSIPHSDFNQEQLYNGQTQCIGSVEKSVDIDTIKKDCIFTDPLILTDCAIEQFRNLISSWSCNDLCCLYLEYEAVYELQLLWKEAIKTRLRAPTLKDDLWSLAQHGWCSNTYLIRNGSTHEAHSYLLASRLRNFDELLTSLNRGKFHRFPNKSTTDHTNIMSITSTSTITNTSTTILTNKASINSLPTSDRLVDQSSDFQSEKCPDLLSSSRLKLQDTSYKMNTETHQQQHHDPIKLPSVSILDPNNLKINTHDVSNSSKMFLTNFLCQLYAGNDPQQLLSKPDLLYQPEINDKTKNTCNTSSNLSKLYNFLKYSHQHKCLLSNDCELIFTCPPILNLKSITLPCHAGILACRSQFLRRILLKRCKSNTLTVATNTTITTTSNTQNSTHKIILDGKIIPGHFATVILHFFYCDYLNLNEISNLLLVFNQQTLLNKLHFNWHTEHSQLNKTTTNNNNYNDNYMCCKSSVEEDHSSSTSTTIPASKCTHAYSSSHCTASDSGSFFTSIQFLMNNSEFNVKQFCLRCPFCLTHLIQLYPVGAILEFHKLSEVCEDLLAEALSLPSIGFENCENNNWKSLSTTTKRQQDISSSVKMSSISLAVGLLRWIDEKSPFTSSSLPEPFLNTQFSRRNNNTSCSPTVSQQSKPNEDSSSPLDNQYIFKSNDNNSHVSSPYNGTSLGFVYRHAIQCLRQNFTSLVRSPSILQRLSPQQLYELLDSSLVQAPESEILAGLLCWGELQLKLKQKNTCSGVQSSNVYPSRDNETNIQPDKISDNVSIEYQSILTSIIDNPSVINCSLSGNDTSSSITVTEENDLSYFNHWLLLCSGWNNVENSMKTPTSNIDCALRLPSCHLCHGTSTSTTTTTNTTTMNNNANNKSVSSESFILNHNLDKVITYTQLIDLVSIVNLLNEYNLLDCIRPAHLLSPMPNELASVLLRYYCDNYQHLNAHNSSTVVLNSVKTLHNFGFCQNKDFFNSPWNSLIHLIKSSQSICSERQFTFEKVLSNPWSSLSPAQFSEKYHWASLLFTDDNDGLSAGHKLNSTNINIDDDCVCCWNKQHLIENSSLITATGASVVRKSLSDNSNVWLNYTNRMKSQLKFLHLPPRLYYPFLNEVRMLFIQKHAVHHQRLHIMNNNNNNVDNFHSQSQSSECTCWEFLLSRKFDQSCNLTNFSPNTTKRIHQSSFNKCHNKSFNLNHQQTYTTDITRDYSQDFSSECDLSFPDLAKKRFGSKSIENNDHNNVNSHFFMNKKFTICCDYKCRDFAYCLLPSSQWTSIIDYYMRLVREFMDDPISHHPCTNNKYIHHILRLRSLWKYGLPDSLESLLVCRINEYMFMLQQPPPSTKQQCYITDCCNPMRNINTLIIKKNNSFVSTTTITTTTTSTASSSSSTSVCSCSLPVMNMTYCEHHTTQRCTFNPSDIGWKSTEITGGSTTITTTTTSRSLYSLSSNNLYNSSGIRNNTINKLTRNSNHHYDHHLVSLGKASQSCSICDDQVILCSVPKNHKSFSNNKILFTSNEQLSNTQCLAPFSCKQCQNLIKSVEPYCHHNDSYFSSYIAKQQKACVQCITSPMSNTTHITDFNNLLLPTYFSKNQFKNGIYSDPNYLLNDGLLFPSVNDCALTKNKSNYHYNLYRSNDQQHCHHRQQSRRQQHQSSDIFYCPPNDHKLSSELLTTNLSSPCYKKVLLNDNDEDKIEKKPICCPYASCSQQTLIQPSPSLSSAISLVHLKNTDGDLRVTFNHNDISSRSSHAAVTEEQYATRLMKLSTKRYDDEDRLHDTVYLPLLLTLQGNVSDQYHHNMSSSFTGKSDLSSDSTNYSSSSSSSSTSFSSPLSSASN